MFFDLEAGLVILCNIICRVQPQVVSSFFLFGVLGGGTDSASAAVPVCRELAGHKELDLLSCFVSSCLRCHQ